jgi:tetratricopeptide (TPR) repeat protein
MAAITYAAEHRPLAGPWLLADTLRGYFWFSMHIVDWLVVAQASPAAAQTDGDLRGQAAAELSLANAYMCQGRYQPAIDHCTRALRLNQQTGWLEGQATVHGSLGLVACKLGRLQEAADHYTKRCDRQADRSVTTGHREPQVSRDPPYRPRPTTRAGARLATRAFAW